MKKLHNVKRIPLASFFFSLVGDLVSIFMIVLDSLGPVEISGPELFMFCYLQFSCSYAKMSMQIKAVNMCYKSLCIQHFLVLVLLEWKRSKCFDH